MEEKERLNLFDIGYVKTVSIGSIDPNNPISEESREQQVQLLNRCLNDFPRGKIIGVDKSIGNYRTGLRELTLEKMTYHIGFRRRPIWDYEN